MELKKVLLWHTALNLKDSFSLFLKVKCVFLASSGTESNLFV